MRVIITLAALAAVFFVDGALAQTTGGKASRTSDGLQFAINRVNIDQQGSLTIQYAVENTTKSRQYLMLFGATSAALDSGETGNADNSKISGLSHCFFYSSGDADSLIGCKNANNGSNSNRGGTNLENYTYIEPGELAQASISYMMGFGHGQSAKTASFTFKALLVTAPVDSPEIEDPSKAIQHARIVNINFPFVPIDGRN